MYLNRIPVVLFSSLTAILFSCAPPQDNTAPERDGPRETMERDIKMMKDPALGYIPSARLITAKQYRDNMWEQANAPISGIAWKELGPNNQGGRTRAILSDANDATGNTVWAGSVGGGLWKTTNINAATPVWTPVNDLFNNLAITTIAQDPSNPLVMYFATGEGYGNGDAVQGLGVWKTTDGGINWAQLASTNNSNFYYCQRIAVNSTGVLFVAAYSGLQRSANGGTSFTRVLGTGLGITGANSNFCYDVDVAANGDVYSSLGGSVHKSVNAGVTFGAAQTLPVTANRIELACAPSDANVIYALCENGNIVAGVLRSGNGGAAWVNRAEPNDADPGIPDTDFSRGQAWYDLSIAVDPTNKNTLFVGGVDIFKSADSAGTWTQVTHWYGGFGSQYAHADQHGIAFKPGSGTVAYFTNDGGIFQTTNANAVVPTLTDKSDNYRTAQFYSCAMHPTTETFYFLAGAQDNGSHRFNSGEALQNSTEVTGGDGAFVHIDQNQPQFQFTSYVYNDFYRSVDGGATWSNFTTGGGDFISPTDYDDAANILYMCNGNNTYSRWDNATTGNTFSSATIPELNGFVSAVKVSPNTANRVFFGTQGGRVVRVDNAHSTTPAGTNISTGLPGGFVSCVEVETGNDNHLLVTFSNYGVNSIWESTNGGTSWTSVEGNLPDMPVRWALFNPNNNDQAVIATELGVWSTDNLNGASTVWGASNSGLANVRVDMLQVRSSDKLMVAATHGRGLFYSDAFTAPLARFSADKFVAYQSTPINFTSNSYKASSWLWDFGDGVTATTENPSHTYATAGRFNVTLTINGGASTVTKTQYIQVLPNRGIPYLVANGGGFELNPDDFGAENRAGTGWQRGNSAVGGKNGTHAGTNAWVTGLTGNYADQSVASLMSPNYNFTAPGTYSLSFWTKYVVENQFDGYQVQYSLNRGVSWITLGIAEAGWYNFANAAGGTAFPAGQPFFTGSLAAYTQRTRDVSFLSGNSSVAFRFLFQTDVNSTAPGVAIDDIEINGPINSALPVQLISFTAFKNNRDILVKWTAVNETNLSRYEIERSSDGLNFSTIGTVNARNNNQASYTYTDLISQLNPIPSGHLYYRLRSTDRNGVFKLSEAVRVLLNNKEAMVQTGPNPFSSYISVYSNEEIKRITLFDAAGRNVFQTQTVNGNRVAIPATLPSGVYTLRVETTTGMVNHKVLKQ